MVIFRKPVWLNVPGTASIDVAKNSYLRIKTTPDHKKTSVQSD